MAVVLVAATEYFKYQSQRRMAMFRNTGAVLAELDKMVTHTPKQQAKDDKKEVKNDKKEEKREPKSR